MNASLKRAKVPADQVILVCRKCGGGKQLRRTLKAAVKDAGRKREIRVVESGCLDVCPKGAVTIAKVREGGATFAVVRPDVAPADVLGA